MKFVGFVRPTIGDEPVLSVEPCMVEISTSPSDTLNRFDMSVRYLSGPKAWIIQDGWTGAAAFDVEGIMLYRIMKNPWIVRNDTMTVVL